MTESKSGLRKMIIVGIILCLLFAGLTFLFVTKEVLSIVLAGFTGFMIGVSIIFGQNNA